MTDKEILQGIDRLDAELPFDGICVGGKDNWHDIDVHELLYEVRERIKWHYPSRGEYPPNRQEVLLCLHTEKGQEIVVGYRDTESDLHEGGGYAWGWYDLGNRVFQDFIDESIQVIAWQYIIPPKEEA